VIGFFYLLKHQAYLSPRDTHYWERRKVCSNIARMRISSDLSRSIIRLVTTAFKRCFRKMLLKTFVMAATEKSPGS
jgi:hypothetical protein